MKDRGIFFLVIAVILTLETVMFTKEYNVTIIGDDATIYTASGVVTYIPFSTSFFRIDEIGLSFDTKPDLPEVGESLTIGKLVGTKAPEFTYKVRSPQPSGNYGYSHFVNGKVVYVK